MRMYVAYKLSMIDMNDRYHSWGVEDPMLTLGSPPVRNS